MRFCSMLKFRILSIPYAGIIRIRFSGLTHHQGHLSPVVPCTRKTHMRLSNCQNVFACGVIKNTTSLSVKNLRPAGTHGIPWRRSKILRRYDIRRLYCNGDHNKGHHRVIEFQQVFSPN